MNREKLTLYALVRFPLCNDREISNMIPVNMSTVTAIKNRLLNKGLLKTIRVPRMDRINSDIVFGWWADFHPLTSKADREELGTEIRERFPEVYYCISDIDSIFCLGFTGTFPDLEEQLGELSMRLSNTKIIRYESAKLFVLPSCYSEIEPCFDCSAFLEKQLPLEMILAQIVGNDQAKIKKIMEELRTEANPSCIYSGLVCAKGPTKLRKKEMKVLYGLVSEPLMPDEQTGRKLNVTRQMVSRSRKDLENKGFLKTVRMPDLKELGVDMIAVIYINFRPDIKRNEWQESTRALFKKQTSYMTILGRDRILGIFPCMDLGDFKNIKKIIIEHLTRKGCLLRMPRIKLFSVSKGKLLKDFVFAPYIQKRLRIEID
ncbi:MAG: hypothetical protein QGH39_11095 [Candidatus Thermoplasmatota archaeon]|nr:hypothetical protein [Candidatus Thermoplasmatota archaeon]